MNDHLVSSIMNAHVPMARNQKIRDSPLMSCLHISGVFDNPKHRANATTYLAQISNQIPAEVWIHSDWWLLEKMDKPEYFKLASRTGLTASMLWYAGFAGASQLKCLEQWITQSSPESCSAKALVALVADHPEDEKGSPRFILKLQSVAKDNGLAFFYQGIPSFKTKSTSHCQSVKSHQVKLNSQILGQSQTSGMRHFGINE